MPGSVPSPPPYIASRELFAEDASRGQFSIRVCVGHPYQVSTDEWACPVALEGLYSRLSDQHGVDAFQSLMLAQRLARTLLLGFVEDGGTLRDNYVSGTVSEFIDPLRWRYLVVTASNNRFERSRGGVFGEPRRGSMIGIKCLRSRLAKPRVAQPHR